MSEPEMPVLDPMELRQLDRANAGAGQPVPKHHAPRDPGDLASPVSRPCSHAPLHLLWGGICAVACLAVFQLTRYFLAR